jgi:hypothetical protein
MKNFLLSFFALSVLVVPVFAFAADTYNENTGIVPCSNTPDENGVIADPCDFNAFMTLINNGISFIIFYMAVPISAIMFAYAGFLMVTAGESASEARTKAKGIFLDALLGLVIALSCWVVVHSIFEVFGYKGGWIGL